MTFLEEPDRIYALDGAGNTIAEVTMTSANGVTKINHTFVDDSLKGQGIGEKLMQAAAQKIRAKGEKGQLCCPYAQDWFLNHPEESDIFYWSCDRNPI